jgi:hypothetical protein
MGVHKVGNWFFRPLADLFDVLAGGGRKQAGVDDQNTLVADDDGGVALGEGVRCVRMADFVNVFGELGDRSLFGGCGVRAKEWSGKGQRN